MDGEDDDLEMLRQAALRSMGRNTSKGNQPKGNAARRTNGNLIEIQPTDSDADNSINFSDYDEVIEEVIVSDTEEIDTEVALKDEQVDEKGEEGSQHSVEVSEEQHPCHRSDDESESDAVSIKSSYSLIIDNVDDNEFQSIESKFLSRKLRGVEGKACGSGRGVDGGVESVDREGDRRRKARSDRRRRSRSRSDRRVDNRRSRNTRRSRSRSPRRNRSRSRNRNRNTSHHSHSTCNSKPKQESSSSHTKESSDDQEDLRTRLIKKKLEKLKKTENGGSRRIFEDAIKKSNPKRIVTLVKSSNSSSSSSSKK